MSPDGSNIATRLPRPRSATVFDGPDRAHARAYMKGIGFDDDALSRPTIGIANPWPGAMPCNFPLRPCGGQFTANTMACAFEALGISAGGSAMVPAEDDDKSTVAEKVGELVIRVLSEDITPSKVITKESLENAIATVCASGGSTNGVLHLIALAHELGIELQMDDFQRISRATRLYASLKPGGRFVATDLYAAGGVPVMLNRLYYAGLLHREQITVTGQTIGEVAESAIEAPGQEVVLPVDAPLKPEGGLAILRGNLAPEGS